MENVWTIDGKFLERTLLRMMQSMQGVLSTPVRDVWGNEGTGQWKWIGNVWKMDVKGIARK